MGGLMPVTAQGSAAADGAKRVVVDEGQPLGDLLNGQCRMGFLRFPRIREPIPNLAIPASEDSNVTVDAPDHVSDVPLADSEPLASSRWESPLRWRMP